MRQNNILDMTICEQLEKIKSEMCSSYCMYPELYKVKYLQEEFENEEEAQETMRITVCENCPLVKL